MFNGWRPEINEQQVLLYAKSGLGKSSLINAGLIPYLETEHNIKYLLIRFKNYMEGVSSPTPLETILSLVPMPKEATFLDRIIEKDNSLWYRFKSLQLTEDNPQYVLTSTIEENYPTPKPPPTREQLSRKYVRKKKKIKKKKKKKTPQIYFATFVGL